MTIVAIYWIGVILATLVWFWIAETQLGERSLFASLALGALWPLFGLALVAILVCLAWEDWVQR